MTLLAETKGRLMADLNPTVSHDLLDISYDMKDDTALCETNPSPENCHYQDFRTRGDETTLAGLPPGLRMTILADNIDNPSFIVLEGKIRYTEALAVRFPEVYQLPDSFATVREVYFRVVQKGTQLWGSFDYKNADNQTIVAPLMPGVDLTAILRNGTSGEDYAGICQNFGSDEWVECTAINYRDYDDLWVGDSNLPGVGPDFGLEVDFSDPPGIGVTK